MCLIWKIFDAHDLNDWSSNMLDVFFSDFVLTVCSFCLLDWLGPVRSTWGRSTGRFIAAPVSVYSCSSVWVFSMCCEAWSKSKAKLQHSVWIWWMCFSTCCCWPVNRFFLRTLCQNALCSRMITCDPFLVVEFLTTLKCVLHSSPHHSSRCCLHQPSGLSNRFCWSHSSRVTYFLRYIIPLWRTRLLRPRIRPGFVSRSVFGVWVWCCNSAPKSHRQCWCSHWTTCAGMRWCCWCLSPPRSSSLLSSGAPFCR